MTSADVAGSLRGAAVCVRATARRAIAGFFADGAPQSAAAISYYALLSLFPLAILMVTAFSLIADDAVARARVIDLVLANLPLREEQGRREIEELLVSVTEESGGFGLAGALGLLFAASGVMGAVRKALNRAWDVEDARPLAQAKAIDVMLVLLLGAIIAASFALTLAARLTASLSAQLEQWLGPAGSAVGRLVLTLGPVVPALVAFVALAVLFSTVPAKETRLRDTWPGAATAALAFEGAKIAFAFYLENFASYAAVYASLAAVVAFMVFVFVSANVVLLGAEVAIAWPVVRDGPAEPRTSEPLADRVRGAVKGLFVRRSPEGPDRAGRRRPGG